MCSAPLRSEGDRISVAAVSLKIVLDLWNTILYLARPVRRGTLSRGVVRVGRERRLRPGSREPRAWEAKANSGGPRVLGPPPSDPTAPHYGGAAMRLEADREKAGASDLCEGQKL